MKKINVILVFLFAVFVFFSCEDKTETPDVTVEGALEDEVFQLVNEYRVSKGLPELVLNANITAECRVHSKNMALGTVPFGHDGFDARVETLSRQIEGVTGAAENVLYGATSAQQAVDLWLNSTGHRENIEGNYSLTGIGVFKAANGDYYFTQIFLRN